MVERVYFLPRPMSTRTLTSLSAVLCLGTTLAATPADPERHPVYEPQGQPAGDLTSARVQAGPGLHLAGAVEDAPFDGDLQPAQASLSR